MQGTYRKHRHDGRIDLDVGQDPLPSAPDWLTGEAKAEWDYVVRGYADSGVLNYLDKATLAAYCALWAEFVEFQRNPLDAEGKRRYMSTPRIVTMSSMSSKLGLDPVARARLRAPNAVKKPDPAAADPWDAIQGASRPRAAADRTADA
jgi:P27 family predicted phage terminase small subunit